MGKIKRRTSVTQQRSTERNIVVGWEETLVLTLIRKQRNSEKQNVWEFQDRNVRSNATGQTDPERFSQRTLFSINNRNRLGWFIICCNNPAEIGGGDRLETYGDRLLLAYATTSFMQGSSLKWQVKLIWRKTEKTLNTIRTNRCISFGLKNNRSPRYKLCYLLSCVLLIKLLKALYKCFHLNNHGWLIIRGTTPLIPHNLFLDRAFTQHLRLLSDQTQNSFPSSIHIMNSETLEEFWLTRFWMNCWIQRCHWMHTAGSTVCVFITIISHLEMLIMS